MNKRVNVFNDFKALKIDLNFGVKNSICLHKYLYVY